LVVFGFDFVSECVGGSEGYIKFSMFEYVGDFSNLWTEVCERGPLLIVGLIRYVTVLWACHFYLEFVYELNSMMHGNTKLKKHTNIYCTTDPVTITHNFQPKKPIIRLYINI
jgi:hypothetical protein